MEVELKEITFEGDHTVYAGAPPCSAGYPPQCWGAGAPLTGLDWAATGNPDHPICYTRNTGMRMKIVLKIIKAKPGTATLRVVGPDGLMGEQDFSVPCEDDEVTVVVTTGALPNMVKAYSPIGLDWYVFGPGDTGFSYLRATNHDIYITLSTPTGSEPTGRRLNFVCGAAWNATTVPQAIDGVDPSGFFGGEGIHTRLNADPPFDPLDFGVQPPWIDTWDLMSGQPKAGECDEQARFMNLVGLLVGVPIGVTYNTWPSLSTDCDPSDGPTIRTAAEAGITWDIDGDGTIGEEELILRFDFHGGTGTGINGFEGSIDYLLTTGKVYTVWPSLQATSKCRLLLEVRDHTLEDTGLAVAQCWARVEAMWVCISDPLTGELVKVDFPDCSIGCP